jgi:CO dehydrogenase/acetyl-CoA synthase epsilon subunit
MNNYAENKNKIEVIRNKVGEIMFRMAISHLMDVGIRHLTEENVKETCDKIMQEDDSKAIMTNEFKCDLVRMAYELAQIPHIDLLVYIQREVDYDVFDGSPSYKRAIQITKNCIDWIICDIEMADARNDLNAIGFDEDELESLGYSYLIEEEE